MYPRVVINLPHLRENVKTIRTLCAAHGISITGITKVFRGDPKIAQVLVDGGITMLGDSRVSNLARMAELKCEKWLIRPPMLSEVEELVRWADVSLNSELVTLRAINEEALRQGKRHKVILMADLGDIREGWVDYAALLDAAEAVSSMPGLELYGLGTNLTCFSFVQSDTEKLSLLADLARRAGERAGNPLPVISGGNSATIDLMLRGGIPAGVNTLRLGESLLFGRERSKYQYLPGTHRDVFTLECKIVPALGNSGRGLLRPQTGVRGPGPRPPQGSMRSGPAGLRRRDHHRARPRCDFAGCQFRPSDAGCDGQRTGLSSRGRDPAAAGILLHHARFHLGLRGKSLSGRLNTSLCFARAKHRDVLSLPTVVEIPPQM